MKKKTKRIKVTLSDSKTPKSNLLIFWTLIIFLIIFAVVLVWYNLKVEAPASKIDEKIINKTDSQNVEKGLAKNDVKEAEFITLNEAQKNFAELTFSVSPDGKSIAYIVNDEVSGRRTMVLNGRAGASYDDIIFMEFSPDSKRFAYGAKVNGKSLVVLDGKEGKLYDWILEPHFFSSDSKYFVYKTRLENGDILVFNNSETQAYDRIYQVATNDDKTELFFFARQGDKIWRGAVDLIKSVKDRTN